MTSVRARVLAIASLAAVACAWLTSGALPIHPSNLPWSPWVAPAALAVSFTTFLLWFALSAFTLQLVGRLSSIVLRLVMYAFLFVVVFYATPILPLVPMLAVVTLCRSGIECGAEAQGIVNILSNMPFAMPDLWVALVCFVLVGAVALGTPLAPHNCLKQRES
jgi:hypothetical protein